MVKKFKRTKILATIGPAVSSPEKIEELIQLGVNGCRLNMAHGDYPEYDRHIDWIRTASKKLDRQVAIVQDLQGPKIRLGMLKNTKLEVKTGDELVLDSSLKEHTGNLRLPVQYNLAEKVKIGEPLYIFDGKIQTEVTEVVNKTAIKVKVKNDGVIMSNKGINLPDTDFSGDVLTDKDIADIEFGVSRDFDYVALSFIQSAEDIDNLRQILLSYGSDAQIIAKIETKAAVKSDKQLEDIVKATDGIMVARGDMAFEVSAEVVPIVQKKLVALCRKHGKLCIVATQMMSSMVDNPEPTRAEVNDIATAVIQGADVVMLSEESAVGEYPLEAVQSMRNVIIYTQDNYPVDPIPTDVVSSNGETLNAISEAAVGLAEKLDVDAIIAGTTTGITAATVAANRPNLPIISVTDSPRVAQQLALMYANVSYIGDNYDDDYIFGLVKDMLGTGRLGYKTEVLVVIVRGQQKGIPGGTDTIEVRKISR
ncbi:pyruvate kinase [Candidatus Saccharibacteria bacterium]|nr:pyruvate kinase [Candidatus Saccharibacteria bacterium]